MKLFRIRPAICILLASLLISISGICQLRPLYQYNRRNANTMLQVSDDKKLESAKDLRKYFTTKKESAQVEPDSADRAKELQDIETNRINYTKVFLAPYPTGRSFWIGRLDLYNVDTLNKYLYSQGVASAFQNIAIEHPLDQSNTFVNVELASFLFGPVRMGFGGSIKSSGDTSKDNATKTGIQKIVNSGGTINFNFMIPLLFCRNYQERYHFGIFGQVNNGLNPHINDSTGATSFSNDLSYTNQTGLLFHFDAGSNDAKALLSFDLPLYYAWASNNAYKELGITDYALLKLQVGITIKSMLDLHISGPLWSSSSAIRKTAFTVSLQFSPSQILSGNN